jgi:hypothetical protein
MEFDLTDEERAKLAAMPSKMKGKVDRLAARQGLEWLWEGSPGLVPDASNIDVSGLDEGERVVTRKNPVEFGRLLLNWHAHTGQEALMNDGHKVVTVDAGRRWGKSEALAVEMLHTACTRPSYQYILSITHDQTRHIFTSVKNFALNGPIKPLIKKVTNSPFPMIEFHNGSEIRCYSTAKDGDRLRGGKAHRIVVDEASRLPDGIIDNVIMPMLVDYKGQLVLISTPAGHNEFYRYWEKGQTPNERYSSFKFPSWSNPHLPPEELEAIKQNTSEVVWNTEYGAEFMDDMNFVFKWAVVNRAVDDELPILSQAEPGKVYVMGVDVAKLKDYTVMVVLDATDPKHVNMVYHKRLPHGLEYGEIVEEVSRVARAFQPARFVVDATGAGNPVVDYLTPEFPQVEGYTFTNALSNPKKYFLIDQLRLGFEQKRLMIFDDKQMLEELKFFEYERDEETNVIKLHAQSGKHDDYVIALALAWSACSVPAVSLDIIGIGKGEAGEYRKKDREEKGEAIPVMYPPIKPPDTFDHYGDVSYLVPEPRW